MSPSYFVLVHWILFFFPAYVRRRLTDRTFFEGVWTLSFGLPLSHRSRFTSRVVFFFLAFPASAIFYEFFFLANIPNDNETASTPLVSTALPLTSLPPTSAPFVAKLPPPPTHGFQFLHQAEIALTAYSYNHSAPRRPFHSRSISPPTGNDRFLFSFRASL